MPPCSRRRVVAALAGCLLTLNARPAAEPAVLDNYVVTATRAPEPPERVIATSRQFDLATLQASPTLTIDETLRTDPSFSLFRRSDSLVANPTTQGVSLRGLGPSGASRSLVLLDGVPLNDPFGGWVNWSALPRDALARVEIVPGGGASAWGNSALGGVVQLFSFPLAGMRTGRDSTAPTPAGTDVEGFTRATTGQASVLAGDDATRSGSFVVNAPAGRSVFQVSAEDFATSGYPVIAGSRRGPVDVAAWSRHRSLAGRGRAPVGATAEITATVRSFEEFRGNGTPYQRNGTRARFAALEFAAQPSSDFAWTLTGYAQDQSYASTFSSVNAARTAETPASDQFAVPSTAAGASWIGTWRESDGATLTAGADGRTVHGETRERYAFSGGQYTRLRVAGGSQTTGGLFVIREQPLTRDIRMTTGLRWDRWSDAGGHRRESDLASGVVSRRDDYPERSGSELSPSHGRGWRPHRSWRRHVSGQRAYRRPTLNELYRPFRQGPNVVEANAALDTETVTSAEAGVTWTVPRNGTAAAAAGGLSPRTDSPLELTATVFSADLRDAVSNVTLAHGPSVSPLFGTLAPGAAGRQRLNLDRIRTQGVELSAKWRPSERLTLAGSFLANDATVKAAAVAPALVGRRLAEVPKYAATLFATVRAPGDILVTPRVRWSDRQFDDDENTLRLAAVVTLDLGLSRALNRYFELFLNLQNVTNARIETARTADGVVSTGTPRLLFGGLRARW
jgi:outer membrane receptor protein involved in Fe transport